MMRAFAFALLVMFCGCSHDRDERPTGAVVTIEPPLGLPPVPIPSTNPPTKETIALGRKLFYDKRLSGDDSMSCATCHNPSLGFSNGDRNSMGIRKQRGKRNAPTVLNTAYTQLQFWDGRADGLEKQAEGPIANPIEMDQPHDVVVSKLGNAYKAEFEKAFGPGPVTLGKIEKALASFERTALSGNSPFDRYLFGGDSSALSPAAIRGFEVFTDPRRGNCSVCHTIDRKYALFTDGKFHNIGIGVDSEGELTDLGRYEQTKVETDKGAFKTPTLRSVEKTGPYMHDGSLKTLKEVVDFYAGGGNSNPYLDSEIRKIKLTATDRADLIEFLKSLTGDVPADAGEPRPQ